MTLKEVFSDFNSHLKFRTLAIFYSGMASQQKWVSDFANWGLIAAGIYFTTIIANLEKLHAILKGNWRSVVIVCLVLSIIIGVSIRLVSAYLSSILEFQNVVEVKLPRALEDTVKMQLPNAQLAQQVASKAGPELFALMQQVFQTIIPKQPLPFRWLSRHLIGEVEFEMEIALKIAMQVYFLSIIALLVQIAFLGIAFVWPLVRFKTHLH